MKRLVFLCLLTTLLGQINAQSLDQARAWFLEEKYEQALPVFEREHQKNRRDGSISYWYAVCLLETGDHSAALPLLEYAKSRRVQNADYYLAVLHYRDLMPEKAAEALETYRANKRLSEANQQRAEALQTEIERLKQQLERIENIRFIDRLQLAKTELFERIRLSKESGHIEALTSEHPDSSAHTGMTYAPEKDDRRYYATHTDTAGLDLFVKHKLLGNWSKPERLPKPVNSLQDDLNPFFLQDGSTFYFASNRPGGLGGLDLYVTRSNPNTNSYFLPDRLNIPFNSTANDYFLVIDELRNRGYLASDRNCPRDSVYLYTFIPNKTTVLHKDKTPEERVALALILNIDRSRVDESPDLVPVNPNPSSASDSVRELFFIRDNLYYDSADSFRSQTAKMIYIRYRERSKQYNEQTERLSQLRKRYAQADDATRATLTQDILDLEKQLPMLQQEVEQLERDARNLEISEGLK